MPQPIKLTYAEVVEAGRKAYLAGELSAQGPSPACRYRDAVGRPCVIGAALSDDEAARTLFGSVAHLAHEGFIAVEDPAELEAMHVLQVAHDEWAEGDEEAHTELRKLLNIEEAA